MRTFISYIAIIGALASNLPYVVSVVEAIPPDICPMYATETTETIIDFYNSELAENPTLGNAAGDGELRFKKVGHVTELESGKRTSIDLVVTQTPGTTYDHVNLANNRVLGHFGQINIASNEGEGTFNFRFINSISGDSITLDTFFFSFLDLDGDTDMEGFETISILEDQISRFWLGGGEDSQVVASKNNETLNFKSTTAGTHRDNPIDQDTLSPFELERTVMFQIDGRESFDVKFAVNCANSGSNCNNGRNFLFAGRAYQLTPGCPTPSPTFSPTEAPTTHPTGDTTDPTFSPPTVVTSNPVTSPSLSPSGAFGDPHIKTWTGKTYDFHGVCDLVLFSNPSFDSGSGVDVHIRNKRMSMWSFIESSAIRIGKDTFELTGGKDNDDFLINGIVQKRKNKNGVVGSISGYDIKFTEVNENSRKFMINLGTNKKNNNVEQIIFTTWKSFVSVSVKNPTKDHFDGCLGLMGSFPAGVMVARDGKTVLDDSNEFGQEWQVLSTEPELFSQRGTVGPNDMCSSPSSIEMRRRLQSSVVTLKEAENACNSVNKEMKDLCIFDVMATNDKSSSGAY